MLTVRQLAEELRNSGWNKSKKVLILAARYYKGLETVETLQLAHVSPADINHIVYMR